MKNKQTGGGGRFQPIKNKQTIPPPPRIERLIQDLEEQTGGSRPFRPFCSSSPHASPPPRP